MTFDVAAPAYERFMGRYSRPLAPLLADFADVRAGQRAIDVGCGTGALTRELVERLAGTSVSAVDPSASFVDAVRRAWPEVQVVQGSAEQLPFADGEFDVALAQLVVHFMQNPAAGLSEMARVTRARGVVAACVWDYAGGCSPLSLFWQAARAVDPEAPDEVSRPGTRQGELAEMLERAGLVDVAETALEVEVTHRTFEQWWEPFTAGVGPAGAYIATLRPDRLAALREATRKLQPEPPFVVRARAWAARGTAT